MKVLIDVGHPADVHLFRNFAAQFSSKNNTVIFTARNKEYTYDLLNSYGIKFSKLGNVYSGIVGKLFGLYKFDKQLFNISKEQKPDIFFSHGSFYSSHISFLLRKPFITFEDTGNFEQIILYRPFADVVITPSSYRGDFGKKQIRFNGSKELAYLHPNYYHPDPNIFNELGLGSDQKYVLLRFVSWNATHDIGHKGITLDNKIALISKLSEYAKVFISSECELPIEFKKYKLELPPNKIFDIMYYASLLFGESATMASECALLGTPAIFVNNANISYTKEQEEKYGLVFNFSESLPDQQKAILKAVQIMESNYPKEYWQNKSKKMIENQIDLTSFMVWFIEQYPASATILRDNPGYQDRFIAK